MDDRYLLSPMHMVGFPEGENMMRIRSISHNMDSSLAFLRIPDRRFEYVTCLPLVFSSFLIFSLTLPIVLLLLLLQRSEKAIPVPPRDDHNHTHQSEKKEKEEKNLHAPSAVFPSGLLRP